MKIKIKRNIPIITPIKVKGEREKVISGLRDTGARITMLSWGTLEFWGYKPYAVRETVNVTTANGVIKCPLPRVKEISV